MKLFNTLTQSLEDFVSLDDRTVRIYVCGITPYDTTHLGHAFTYVSFDTLIRYLEFRGYTVNYVQNVTDIDDDVLRKARELGMMWDELGRRETERYLRDMDSLNVRRPNVYARATQETPTMIEIVQTLISQGYAYESGGSVYYSVKRDPDFGVVRVRAYGTYDFHVVDPKLFLKEVAGTDDHFRLDEFADTMRSRIVSLRGATTPNVSRNLRSSDTGEPSTTSKLNRCGSCHQPSRTNRSAR